MNDIFIILIVIIIILFVSIIVLSLASSKVVSSPASLPPPIPYSKAGFGSKCSLSGEVIPDSSSPQAPYLTGCQDGMICYPFPFDSSTEGLCYKDIGQPCNTLYECVPGTVQCNQKCLASVEGDIGNYCNNGVCNVGICDINTNMCVYQTGTTGCQSDSQCYTGITCNNGYCQPRLADGSLCSNDNGCLVGSYCSSGICQPNGYITSISIGSYCIFGTTGCSGSTCNYSLTSNSSFPPSGLCEIYSGETWPYTGCSKECLPPSICYTDGNSFGCVMPRLIQNGIVSNSPNINSCDPNYTTGVCTQGYSCNGSLCIPSEPGVPYDQSTNMGICQFVKSNPNDFGHWDNVFTSSSIPAANPSYANLSSSNVNGEVIYIYNADQTLSSSQSASQTFAISSFLITPSANTIQQFYITFNLTIPSGFENLTVSYDFRVLSIKFTPSGNLAIILGIDIDPNIGTGVKAYVNLIENWDLNTNITITYPGIVIYYDTQYGNLPYGITTKYVEYYDSSGNINNSSFAIPYGVNVDDQLDYIMISIVGTNYLVNGYYTDPNTLITNITQNVVYPFAFPYPYYPTSEQNLGSYIYGSGDNINLNTSNQIQYTFPLPPDNQNYTMNSCSLSCGALDNPSQINLFYIMSQNGTYYARMTQSFAEITLPGYFTQNSLPSLTAYKTGNVVMSVLTNIN